MDAKLEEIRGIFISKGCTLISENIGNAKTHKLNYICKCGTASTITLSEFKKSRRKGCRYCSLQKIEDIRELFSAEKCILISEEYRQKEKLDYICSCGNKSSITLPNFKNGVRCRNCGDVKKNAQKAYTLDKAKIVFEASGLTLVDEVYVNNKTKMKAVCSCGNPIDISLDCAKKGVKCKNCGYLKTSVKLSGENHYKFRHDLTYEDRVKAKRNSVEAIKWKYAVRRKFKNKCHICDSKIKIHAHHLFSYHKHPELRVVIANGALLCEKCHTDFHSKYGSDVTVDQFNEYSISRGCCTINVTLEELRSSSNTVNI